MLKDKFILCIKLAFLSNNGGKGGEVFNFQINNLK